MGLTRIVLPSLPPKMTPFQHPARPIPTPDPRIDQALSKLDSLSIQLNAIEDNFADKATIKQLQGQIESIREEIGALKRVPTPTPDPRVDEVLSKIQVLETRPTPTPIRIPTPVPTSTPDLRIDELLRRVDTFESKLGELAKVALAPTPTPLPTPTPKTVVVIATPSPTPPPAPDIQAIGGVIVTMHGVKDYNETDSYYLRGLSSNEKFIVVELTVDNQTTKTITFGRIFITVQTQDALLYEYKSSSAMGGYRTLGDLPPGTKVRFPISFKIPKDKTVVKVFYTVPEIGGQFVFTVSS